ncbi:MAG: hypothetical protein AAF411_00645 [Myxococcota bacterium]
MRCSFPVRTVAFVALAATHLSACARSISPEDAAVEDDGSTPDVAVLGDAETRDAAPDVLALDAALDTAAQDTGPFDTAMPLDASPPDALDAAPVDANVPPSDFNRVFVSSQTFAMNLGGVDPYDEACNRLASAAGLQARDAAGFIAWISSQASDAASRLGDARGFVRMDGQAFADELLASEVFRGVRFDERGTLLPPGESAATGTRADGTASFTPNGNCNNWTSRGALMLTGPTDGGPRSWTSRESATCSVARRIYCVETVRTRELIPEPETGRLIYLTNDDFEPGGDLAPEDACEASKPEGAGDVAPLLATLETAASDVLDDDATYVRPDGVAVGTGAELRAGVWRAGAWQEGSGAYPSDVRRVWTGSERIDLIGDMACDNWTSESRDLRGHYGFPASPVDGAFWTTRTRRCTSTSDLRLYCVETSD